MGTINFGSSYLQSILGSVLQNTGLTGNTTGVNPTSTGTSSVTPQTDNQQLSPFAQMMTELQQLQQSDPSKYQQVTQQIATNLQSAAQTAQADGNSTAASQLTQLATDFTNASQSGQLPNVQDLLQAAGGGHHHHHHGHGGGSEGSSSANAQASQLLSAFQSSATQSDSLNPTSIILNTLSSAGITSSNS